MTPIREAFREGILDLPRRLWGRAPQEAEVENGLEPDTDGAAFSDPNTENEEHERDEEYEEDEDSSTVNTLVIVDPPYGAGELKRQVEGNQASPQTTRTPLSFHTIGPNAPVLNLTPSTPAPTPQPPSSAVATRPAQTGSSATAARTPVLPRPDTLASSSTFSGIATGVSDSTTAVPTQADTQATAEAVAVGGLNGGQIAGAAVGGLAVIALVANGIFFYKRRRRRPAEIVTLTPTTKETIRRIDPPAAAMPAASAPLTKSALKFNPNAPRLPREQWPRSMEVLESRVKAEYAAAQQKEERGQGHGDQKNGAARLPREQWSESMQVLDSRIRAEYAAAQQREAQGQGYEGQGYPGQAYGAQEYQGQGHPYQGGGDGNQEYYEARVYMR